VKTYITSTFSPLMIQRGGAKVRECKEQEARRVLLRTTPREQLLETWESAVSHEITARLISEKFGVQVPFNRVNLSVGCDTRIIAICPIFRASIAREYTAKELKDVKWRYFIIRT